MTALELSLLFRSDASPIVQAAGKAGDAIQRMGERARALQEKLKALQSEGQSQMLGGAATLLGAKKLFLDPFMELDKALTDVKLAFLETGGTVNPFFDRLSGQMRQFAKEGKFGVETYAELLSTMKREGSNPEILEKGLFRAASKLMDVAPNLSADLAARIAANETRTLGIESGNEARYLNIRYKAANALGLDYQGTNDALTYLAPKLQQFGKTGLEEGKKTLAFLGTLSQGGLKGSMLGTAATEFLGRMAEVEHHLKMNRGLGKEVEGLLSQIQATTGKKVTFDFFDKNGKMVSDEKLFAEVDKIASQIGDNEKGMSLLGKYLFGEGGERVLVQLSKRGALKAYGASMEAIRQAGSVEDARKVREESPAQKWQTQMTNLRNTMAGIGGTLQGPLSAALDKLNNLLGIVERFVAANPRLTGAILGSVVALGGFNAAMGAGKFVLGGALGPILGMARGLGSLASGAKTAFEWAQMAGGPVKGLLSYLSYGTPLMQRLGKILSMDVGAGLKSLWTGLVQSLPVLWANVTAAWAWTTALLANPITWVVVGIMALIGAGLLLWKNWDKVTTWFKTAWSWFQGMWAKVPGWVGLFLPFIGIPMLIIRNWDKIKGALGAVWEWIKGFSTRFWDAGGNLVKALAGGILAAITHPVDAIRKVLGRVGAFLGFGSAPAPAGIPAPLQGRGFAPAPALAPARAAAGHTLQFSIDARGAAPGTAQDIHQAIRDAIPTIRRELDRQSESAGRRAF
jgi:TP901 family phage tail tape measure protein